MQLLEELSTDVEFLALADRDAACSARCFNTAPQNKTRK